MNASKTTSTLKEKIGEGKLLLGGFVFSSDSNVSEIYAECGYDFVIIDLEHALNDLRIVQSHLRACAASGIHAIVRLGASNYADGSRLLDAGAEGLMIPHFGENQSIDALVQSMKYWPEGQRPTCTGVQIAGYGQRNFLDAATKSNKNVLSIGLIEDKGCIDDLEGILTKTAVDWLMPGPADLASSFGLHGQLTHPDVQAAIRRIIKTAQAKNIPVGIYINEMSDMKAWSYQDIQFVVHSIDYKQLGKVLRKTVHEFHEYTAKNMINQGERNGK